MKEYFVVKTEQGDNWKESVPMREQDSWQL